MHHLRRERVTGSGRRVWAWTRVTIAVAILAVLVWRLGAAAFLEPLRRIDVWSLVAATGIGVLTTVSCAWRWRLVSCGLGSDLPMRAAVAAYYRSQFLNTVLPGGVLGDVHRAVRRGRDVGDVAHAARVVVWERTAGQVVQVALTFVVLLVLPSPVRSAVPFVAGAVVAVALFAMLLGRTPRGGGASVPGRVRRAVATDLRDGLLARRAWPGVVLASTVVVTGHAVTFMVAARAAGSTASPLEMLPLALLVLLAMGLPTNVAGWGPREGVAAWVFALAGLGATQGVAAAVVYGVMVLVATLPGSAVLAAGRLHRDSSRIGSGKGARGRWDRQPRPSAGVPVRGAAHG
jgi:uncharacterized membrane protein YbhN (UPF0104 family)